jgi:predicted nucleic acid-binding protein
MPGYLLDTDILSDLVHRPRSGMAARQLALVRAHGVTGHFDSIIAAAELRYGVAKRGSARRAR